MNNRAVIAGILLAAACAQPAFAVNDYFPTWYVGLRGSVNTMHGSDLGTVPLPDTEWDPGFSVGATAGVKLPRAFIEPLGSLSFEGEISRYWQHIDNDRSDLTFPLMIPSDGEREYTITSYMVNAYYHIPVNTLFRPYIGGGIGRAKISLENDPIAPNPGKADDTVPAWQVMLGLNFEPHPHALTEWNIGYRYFTADNPEFDDGFGGVTKIETDIHALEAGIRFRF